MSDGDRTLWSAGDVACVIVSCCSGAELQLRRRTESGDVTILRELYPTHSDVYERARMLKSEIGGEQL